MAGLVPAIHAFLSAFVKTWMPAASAGMTTFNSVLLSESSSCWRKELNDARRIHHP
jgi:hypothetical protein